MPRKRRASLYEDVTVDTQPSVHRHMSEAGRLTLGGRGTWTDQSTRLRCTDWFDFRDPAEQWSGRSTRRAPPPSSRSTGRSAPAIKEGLLDDFHPERAEFLRGFLDTRDYETDCGLRPPRPPRPPVGFGRDRRRPPGLDEAARRPVDRALRNGPGGHHGPFPIEEARRSFLEDAEWQPTRRYLERLAATHDWGEVIVAANLCLEPIVGTLIRRELGTRAAAANGDTVTPVLARGETREWEWARAWTTDLTRFLLEDAAFAETNRAVISEWVNDWLPLALEAALALVPVARRIPTGIDVEQALKRLRAYASSVLIDAGLPELSRCRARPRSPSLSRRSRQWRRQRNDDDPQKRTNKPQRGRSDTAEPPPPRLRVTRTRTTTSAS